MELIYISMLKNKKIKVIFVFGTRPEAVKLAPVIKEFQKNNKLFETRICVTAQHRELFNEYVFRFWKADLEFVQKDITMLFTVYLTSFYQKILVALEVIK